MSVNPNHRSAKPERDKPIHLEPVDQSPQERKGPNTSPEVQSEPLTLAPESPITRDAISIEAEKFRVPNSTQYRCANCDYILAGLTSRRCPECGEPFTLDAAQMHGRESSPDMVHLDAAVRRDTIKFYAGVSLLVAAFMAPNIAGGASLRSGPISFRGLLMLIVMFPALMFTAYFRQSGDFKWCDLLLLVGILIAILGALLAIL